MASIAGIAAQQSPADLLMASGDAMGSELYSRRAPVRAPEPNPNFSFPRRLPEASIGSTPAAFNTLANPTRKRIRPTDLSLLPHKPLEQEQLSTSPSNQQMDSSSANSSPSKARPMSSRGGHRRGGSEFIGGDAASTGVGLKSSSPTRGANTVESTPSAAAASASAGRRRGHAHRRSGAMSTTDFSAILNQSISNAPPLPGSAPTSPSVEPLFTQPIPVLERHHSQPGMTTQEKIEEANAAADKEDLEMAAATESGNETRARVVGFSDKVVIIPRPLSTISSGDTESTMSTIRPSHSVSNSISSVLDQRPPTPVSATLPPDSSDESRPATSDTTTQTDFFGPAAEGLVDVQQRPSSGSGNRLMKRRRSPPPHLLADDDMSPRTGIDPRFLASMALDSPRSPGGTSSPVTETKPEKRKNGLRSILSRKHRKESKEESLTEVFTPPVSHTPMGSNVPDGLMSLDDVNFDDDTTCIIHSADYQEPTQVPLQTTPSPMQETFDKDDSAVLDLDATYNAVHIDDDSPSSFASFMGGTIPMRQHRRTESAPSLSPMQRLNFGPGKASPKMADVFEEDEEDEAAQQRSQRPKARSFHQPKPRNLQGLGVQIVDADAGEAAQPRRKSRSPSSKFAAPTEKGGAEAEAVAKNEYPIGTATTTAAAATTTATTTTTTNEFRFSTLTMSSTDGTITPGLDGSPRLQPNPALDAPLLDPISTVPTSLDFAIPQSTRPHATHDSTDYSTSSTAPSPNPTTISFDGPRLNTAASSITERTNWSSAPSQPNGSSNALTCRGAESTASEEAPSSTPSPSTAFSSHNPHVAAVDVSASPSPVIPRGPSSPFGQSYHAHTFSGLSRPRTTGFANGEGSSNNARPNSVAADRAFSIGGLGGLSPRSSMPRSWGSRPSTANASKRNSLASLSKLMSRGDGERSKLSMSWGAHDDKDGSSDTGVLGAKEGKEKGGRRRLSKMFKFLKPKSKDRTDDEQASQANPLDQP